MSIKIEDLRYKENLSDDGQVVYSDKYGKCTWCGSKVRESQQDCPHDCKNLWLYALDTYICRGLLGGGPNASRFTDTLTSYENGVCGFGVQENAILFTGEEADKMLPTVRSQSKGYECYGMRQVFIR